MSTLDCWSFSPASARAAGNLAAKKHGAGKLLASFARYPAGALSLFNYPLALRTLPTTDNEGKHQPGLDVDMAATDIYRDRERGILRYNEFRRQLRMNPVTSWHELAGGDAVRFAHCLRGHFFHSVFAYEYILFAVWQSGVWASGQAEHAEPLCS